ncbi:hypothetical protein KORDIASMS9_00495 [Kordia sp. SMS9]|uniref:hypothetical protein n=1 Tax=Kordia sp. SMS9 TaxID=2282170 RepID=UPI000E0DC4A4|nr:hypothetical protein [Kordia sp. SMS9]AXG68301.1 hypothetical protein KORDIASMS9_00495 [Kordia sp. SMS9]
MSQKQKLLFLSLFLMIGLFFNACLKDHVDDISDENNLKDSPFTSRIISKNEYQQNKNLLSRLQFFTSETDNKPNSDKDYYDVQNGIVVYTNETQYIEYMDGNLHSYTFSMRRSNSAENLIENIVFTYVPSDDDYEANIITYHLSAGQKQVFIETGHLTGNYTISDESIDLDFSVVAPKNSLPLPCTTNFTVYHLTPDTNETFVYSSTTNGNVIQNQCQHTLTGDPCYEYLVVEYDCPDSSSGGPSGSTGNPTAGGGGGTNDGSNDDLPSDPDVVTQPFIDLNQEQIKQRLTDYSNDDTIKAKMIEYRAKIPTDRKEIGARFRLISDSVFGAREATTRNGASVSYVPRYVTGEIVSVHIHVNEADVELDDGTILENQIPSPMYSQGDILEFFENIDDVADENKDKVTSILITREGTFALVVNDKDEAQNAATSIKNSDSHYEVFLYTFRLLVLKDSQNLSDADFVKRVVNFINTHSVNGQSMGISVYQATIADDGNTITDWRKL